jgi:hypothetical protein
MDVAVDGALGHAVRFGTFHSRRFCL